MEPPNCTPQAMCQIDPRTCFPPNKLASCLCFTGGLSTLQGDDVSSPAALMAVLDILLLSLETTYSIRGNEDVTYLVQCRRTQFVAMPKQCRPSCPSSASKFQQEIFVSGCLGASHCGDLSSDVTCLGYSISETAFVTPLLLVLNRALRRLSRWSILGDAQLFVLSLLGYPT